LAGGLFDRGLCVMPELSILMPVYNERATVDQAVRQVMAAQLGVSHELLIVDDGSTDGTSDILSETSWPEGTSVFRHARNRGKGAALVTALEHAQGRWSAVLDADLEYDPEDIARLLPFVISGEADAVFGSRNFTSHASYGFWYVMGNKGVTLVANVLFNSWISDIMTCQKVMPTELFRSLRIDETGFGVEAEITARLLRRGNRVFEVPISYRSRTRAAGKKLTALDGLRTVRTLMRCRVEHA
jgi:dolichol-phosphate hexosyltransferase